MHNEVWSPDASIGHLLSLCKTKLPATIFSLGVVVAQMLSNALYELFLPGVLRGKVTSLGKDGQRQAGAAAWLGVLQGYP